MPKSIAASGLAVLVLVVSGLCIPAPAGALARQAAPECRIDLAVPGAMKDVVSNALLQGLHLPEKDVEAFLLDAQKRYATGPALLSSAAAHYNLDEAVLAAEVERFKHVNCAHARAADDSVVASAGTLDDVTVSTFARDVTLHVVLHEIGHALVREFDLPILANEEAAADAFATYYLTTYLPDRAVDVLVARVTSLMIEGSETPDVDWRGEHDDDARRAFQIAALAVAADPVRYKPVADVVGMSEDDISDARDYGAEIRRSWRRTLAPLWMPPGADSPEARVRYDAENPFITSLCGPAGGADGLAAEIESAVTRFDWHSQVTIRFVDGDGGAGWNRSSRTITVNSGYVRRFIAQGNRGLPAE